MTGPVFVDTNVLVYARDASEPEKQPQAAVWLNRLWRLRAGRLSVQVLHEFFVTVTGKLRPGMTTEAAREDVRTSLAWQPVALTPKVLEQAWHVQDRYELSFWDALIAASAHVVECRYLLTEDLQDGLLLAGLTVINPFSHAPDEIGLGEAGHPEPTRSSS